MELRQSIDNEIRDQVEKGLSTLPIEIDGLKRRLENEHENSENRIQILVKQIESKNIEINDLNEKYKKFEETMTNKVEKIHEDNAQELKQLKLDLDSKQSEIENQGKILIETRAHYIDSHQVEIKEIQKTIEDKHKNEVEELISQYNQQLEDLRTQHTSQLERALEQQRQEMPSSNEGDDKKKKKNY